MNGASCEVASPSAAAGAAAAPAGVPLAPRARILLVDDQPANLIALEALLADLGQDLVKAQSGAEALRYVLDQDFALILMDVQMPDMTGLETAALIRQRDKSRYTPIIFLTAHETTEVQRFTGYSLGAVDYLVKPLVPEILRSKVAVFVDLFGKTEQVKQQAELLRVNQEREHDRRLAEERQRWELERLREEAARERRLTDALRQKAEELTRTVAERMRAEKELSAVKDELAVQLADMTRLQQLCARLSESLELASLCQEVVAAVTALQGTDIGALCLYDRERDELAVTASVGLGQEYLERFGRLPLEIGASGLVATRDVLVVEDTNAENGCGPRLPASRLGGYRALHSVPLLTRGGNLVGAVTAYFREPHRPAERHSRLVELYAHQAAQAIDNARLHRQVQEAGRRKDEFLAMLAHELRNPLAPALNALHIMRQTETNGAAGHQARDILERQIRQMSRLVDDLLDVSRITRGKIELRLESVALAAVVERAVESTQGLMAAAGHQLDVRMPAEPLYLCADPTRLEQVLANLLNNAAKYTPPGGRIVLEAAADGDEVVLRVQDNGIGIAAEMLSRVFELFAQAERSLDRSQGGLGIGLTLVQRLVEMHGGSVHAESAGVGMGSEFVVRLPRKHAAAPLATPNKTPAPAPGPPVSVLVVDDSEDTAETMAMLLRLSGHRVHVANSGSEALTLAAVHRPEVVLMDIGLPGMDGYEAARRLRLQEGMADALLVAMTGYGQEEDRRRSREAGFDRHLVKPVDISALHQVLARLPACSVNVS